jgi:hypothetical protein
VCGDGARQVTSLARTAFGGVPFRDRASLTIAASWFMPSLHDRTRAGIRGEEQVAAIIRNMQAVFSIPNSAVHNPVVLSRDRNGQVCRTHHRSSGALFGIEAKNYIGRITRATEHGDELLRTRTRQLRRHDRAENGCRIQRCRSAAPFVPSSEARRLTGASLVCTPPAPHVEVIPAFTRAASTPASAADCAAGPRAL